MKKQLTLSLIFLLSVFSYSYGEWEDLSLNFPKFPLYYNMASYSDTLYIAMDSTIYYSPDNGESWEQFLVFKNEYNDKSLEYLQFINESLIVQTTSGRCFVSKNKGNTFERIVLKDDNNEDCYFFRIKQITAQNDTLYMLREKYIGYYYSADGGTTWTFRDYGNNAGNSDEILATNKGFGALGKGLFALTTREILFSYNGLDWKIITNQEIRNVFNTYRHYLQRGITNIENKVFLSIGPYLFSTINNGMSWEKIHEFNNGVIEGKHYYTCLNQFSSCNKNLYASALVNNINSSAGLFLSTDQGFTWQKIIPGDMEPYVPIFNNNYAILSMKFWTNRYFRHELTDCIVDEVMGIEGEEMNGSDILLYQNNPNPFSDETEIMYYIPDNYSGSVRLIISDERGESIIKETEACFGRPCAITIDAGEFPTGVYVYAIEINGRIAASKKMIIIK